MSKDKVTMTELRSLIREEVEKALQTIQQEQQEPEWITPAEAARRKGCTHPTVMNMVRDGRLRTKRVGKKFLIDAGSLEKVALYARG